jgi:pimeloyl-ACP methyl ester carboxylesterase
MADKNSEAVLLLHGIAMPKLRMAYVEHCLKKSGYKTINLGYPSVRNDIETCAKIVAERIREATPDGIEKLHIVAHSLGTLVALHLLADGHIKNHGRLVLVAPPYGGSEVADFMHKTLPFRLVFGPAGAQLTTAYRRAVTYALPEGTEIGVIAGSRAFQHPFFIPIMKKTGAHDGLVSVASTRIPDIKDHITLRFSHSTLLEGSPAQMVHFLKQGCFLHPSV